MQSELNAIALAMITTGISLFALYFKNYRTITLILSSITFTAYILLIYLNKIDKHEIDIKNLRETLKRSEDLITIRADIEYLKRGLTK